MTDSFFAFLIFSVFGVYLLFKLNHLAIRARQNQLKEEFIREAVKKHIQKKKLDELYGRDE